MIPVYTYSRFLLTGLIVAMLLTAGTFGFRRGYDGAAERGDDSATARDICAPGAGWNPMKVYGLPFTLRPELPSEDKLTLPVFPGCEGVGDYEERVFCGFRRLLAFIDDEQRQPPGSAAERVFVKVWIDLHGRMTDPRVIRGEDQRNRQEALRVVQLLLDRDVRWTPATLQRVPQGRAYVIPFTFHGVACSI